MSDTDTGVVVKQTDYDCWLPDAVVVFDSTGDTIPYREYRKHWLSEAQYPALADLWGNDDDLVVKP